MEKFTLILLTVFLVILVYFYFKQNRKRNLIQKSLNQSNGTFDKDAQKALETLETLDSPNSHENFIKARIIDLNAHEGKINNKRVLNNVVDKYMTSLLSLDNELDWFELDQIENFAERHINIMVENPQYDTFIETVLKSRPEKVKKTVQDSKKASSNKKESFENYVDSNVTFTNDVQNVHDSAVNEQLRTLFNKLKEETPPVIDKKQVTDEITEHINTTRDKKDKEKALYSLKNMASDKFNSTINTTEDNLVNLVWNRSKMPLNYENKHLIQDAVVDSLIDMSSKNDSIVCSNGRCARMLESLVCTDAETDIVTGVMTTEQIRNDILQKSNEILQTTIETEKDSKDKNIKNVALSYCDPSIENSEKHETEFKDKVKQKIHDFIYENYTEKLSSRDFENIKKHCDVAIESM